MKTPTLILALMILALAPACAQTAFSNESVELDQTHVKENVVEFQSKLYQENNQKVNVLFAKKPTDVFQVKIFSDRGVLLYKQKVKKNNLAKMSYDLSQFPDGQYHFKVYCNKELVKEQTFKKSKPEVEVDYFSY